MDVERKKTVLITGCSTGGIGAAMASAFYEQGYYVFATARDPSKISMGESNSIEVLELDVTIPETISRCRNIVAKRTGGRLDILVNNAGIELNYPLLDTNVEEARRLFDVNFWGPLAMIQAFAPMLIKAKGILFNQSSIDAALNMAWAGIFASSKAAIARLSETLRVELEPLGVRVVTSMCGSADTPMFTKQGGRMDLPDNSYYHGIEAAAWNERMNHQRQATNVNVLAGQLVKAVVGGAKGMVWHGAYAPSVSWANWLNFGWLLDQLINSQRGINQIRR